MKNKTVYYHNPRCSKSREGLVLRTAKGIEPEIKEYLKEGISPSDFLSILAVLKISPLEGLIRTKEAVFKELDLKNKKLTDKEWAKIVSENPSLLERPILQVGEKVAIGRPPEHLLTIL